MIRDDFSFGGAVTFLAAFAAAAVLSVLIGRFFCGWLCAFGTFNDYVYLISGKIFKKKFKIARSVDEKFKYLKYVVLICIIIFIWTFNLSPKYNINPWDAFAQLPQIGTVAPQIPIAFILLALITIGAMFIERFFCRYLCPLGAILSIFSKFKIMSISKPSEKCGNCQLCTRNCPMGINLSKIETVDSGECISCFKCVDVCHRSNPGVVAFKKINVKWYSSAITALLLFTLIFFGKKYVKVEARGGNKSGSAQMSKADESVYNDGTYIGIGTGFRPNLKVEVTIDQGKISDIKLISHEETKGYYEQAFEIVSKEIITAQQTDVDTVSGATKSSNGIKEAVKDALNKARKQGTENQEVTDSKNNESNADNKSENLFAGITMEKNLKFKDGTYTGIAAGFKPGLTLSVTIKGGKIADIQILSDNETAGFKEKAFSTIPQRIIAAQSIDVDIISGATMSSKGIIAAVKNALEKAIISGELPTANTVANTSADDNNKSAVSSDIDTSIPANSVSGLYKDGVYNGTGIGFQPGLKVAVTVNDGKISGISILEHNETPGFYEKAFNIVPNEIISKQSTNVDTVSGATKSSNGIMMAVNDALNNAKQDVNDAGNTVVQDSASNNTSNSTTVVQVSSVYKDGRYTGIGTGRRDNLTLDVTLQNNKITHIDLIYFKEDLAFMNKAFGPMTDKIIAAQSTDVDIVSGATQTSNGIKDAVNKALEKAILLNEQSAGATSIYPGQAELTAPFKDGVYAGKATGFRENLTVSVTIKDNRILNIEIGPNNETESFFNKVWPVVPNAIIEKQSSKVDLVSGATRSSLGVVNAVNETLRAAHDAAISTGYSLQ